MRIRCFFNEQHKYIFFLLELFIAIYYFREIERNRKSIKKGMEMKKMLLVLSVFILALFFTLRRLMQKAEVSQDLEQVQATVRAQVRVLEQVLAQAIVLTVVAPDQD
ncbi:hypothetical protein P4679_22850 [Priestia megaterium]|uniref:hypothetical protein n=1 Tax=Priestia megaterium TaxID=1404 RepID=UPI002E1C6CC8|nr:hypothetical protein [Priestia megaterium]